MKILKLLFLFVLGVILMSNYSNSSPFPYNPSEPIGIEKNGTFFDLFNSPNSEYFDFYINQSGVLISNYPDHLVAKQKLCYDYGGSSDCLDSLPFNWKNQTDNLTYAWLNGTYSSGPIDFQAKYSVNQTSEPIKIDYIFYNTMNVNQNINASYVHFDLSLDNSNGSDTFVWIDEARYNLTINQTISNITAKELRIYGIAENPFIYMSWNDTAIVEIKSKEVYLKFVNILLPKKTETTRTIFWIDPISSVTLNDPTTDIAIYSSKWFWMNCTAAKSGAGDTPQYLYFEHNTTANANMRIIKQNSGTSEMNTSSTNPISSFLYATMYSINVSAFNSGYYNIWCLGNNTAGTSRTSAVRKITVLQTNVSFNMSSLNLGTANQNSQPLMKSAIVFSNGTNNNVNISCLTGNCNIITTNFTSMNLLDNGTQEAFFNCSTSTDGFFSANFTVNSTQYKNSTLSDTNQMNVSCSITDTTPPNILIRNPSNNSVLSSGTKVYANYTYGTDVNSVWYELDSNDTNITIAAGQNITFTSLQEIIHNITLYANDSSNNINSSFVNFSINIAIPTAFSIVKNITNIYTGTQANFSANWTDNTGLSSYIFSWNNSGAWINSSFSLFNGDYVSQNISNITANAGDTICWRFFANDSSDNWNMTMPNQCFTVNSTYINWSVSSFTIGDFFQGTGNYTANRFINSTGINANVLSGCSVGNCSVITSNFTSTPILYNKEIQNVLFTCNTNSAPGSYTISFYANSSRDFPVDYINVSCTIIEPDTTPPNILIVNPQNNSVLTSNKIYVNYTYGTDSSQIDYEFDSNNTNITITIGSNITFTALDYAIHNISIYAQDGSLNINASFINFSILDTPTLYSSIQKNQSNAYQNSYANFSANWSDANELSGYIFTWNNSGTWLNASFASFASPSTVSFNISRITAVNGSYVCWKFFANDTRNRWNMTMPDNCFTVNQTYINWSVSSLDLGETNQNASNLTGTVFVNSTGINSNSNASFVSGNYTVISHNYSSKTLQNNQIENVLFTCNPLNAIGFYTANFYVNSTEDISINELGQINVSCNIISPDIVPPDILIVNPSNNSVLTSGRTFYANYTYGTDANATWYELDSNNTNITITIGSNITFTNLAKTLHNISLYANDSFNNINSSFINFSSLRFYCSGNFNNTNSNFNITSNVECSNESMNIDGNITISYGNLTLKNITIAFQTTADGSNYINKTNNGNLWILDNDNNQSTSNDASKITSSTSYKYDFWVYGNGINDNFTIKNSVITEAGYSANCITSTEKSCGIRLSNIDNITISGNNISYGGYNGIYLKSGDNNTIMNNLIYNSTNGIILDVSVSNINISNNTIYNHTDSGIDFLSDNNNNTIAKNIIYDNAYNGISISEGSDNIIKNNLIKDNLRENVYFSSAAAPITGSIIKDNHINNSGSGYDNIYIIGTAGGINSNFTIENNNISFSGKHGINIISLFNSTIKNNSITNATNIIYISSSSNINISLGTIRNSTNGIVLYNSKSINATNITFTGNTYDFNITNSSSLTSINNTFNKTVKVLDLSNFTIMWFAEVYVNDNQANTNVSVWNTTGARHGNSTTNSLGLTPLFLLTELMRNNSANLTSNNPFNFTADNTTFFNSTSVNVDRSMRVVIGFTVVTPPIITGMEIRKWEAIDWIQDLGENIYNVSNYIFNPIRWLFIKIREVIEWMF